MAQPVEIESSVRFFILYIPMTFVIGFEDISDGRAMETSLKNVAQIGNSLGFLSNNKSFPYS